MRVGVDLGGTKIEAIALADDGTVLARERIATPRDNYQATIEAIGHLISQVTEGAPSASFTVGVGMPGSHHPRTGLVQNANSTWLNGQQFEADLSSHLGYQVRTANDANCFALSEAVDGAGKDARSVFGVILGTGTGGGIVIDKCLHDGPNHTGGEWGHSPLPWHDVDQDGPARPCYCGRHNCVETFLSGPGLSKTYQSLGGDASFEAKQIASLTDDPIATQALNLYAGQLARGLGVIISILDPEVIIIGGGVSQIDQLYDLVPALWHDWAFTDHVETKLVKAAHGDSSGVRGAAWLWPQTPA